MTDVTTITSRGDQPYDVTVGRGILDRVAAALPASARKVLIVHPPTLATQAATLRESLLADGTREVLIAEIPDAEQGKRVEVAAFCWQILGQADFTRTDAIVGFGGGAVTDLAGFVAATWLRGVAVVQVPTTVLGMVDAAVGGKTGINTAEGKNLVGAFWPPRAVVCDLELLDGLSPNERTAGFAEVVKAGFIWAPEILDLIEADPVAAVDPHERRVPPLHRARDRHEGAASWGRTSARRGCARSSTTATPSGTRSSTPSATAGATAPPISVGMVFAAELSRLAGQASGCRGPAPSRHPRAARPAHELPRRRLAAAAGDDAARQEEPRRDAALHRARRHRAPHRAAGAGRVAAVRRLPGGGGLT